MGFALGLDGLPAAQQERADLLKVASGIPDPRLLPGAALARAIPGLLRWGYFQLAQ